MDETSFMLQHIITKFSKNWNISKKSLKGGLSKRFSPISRGFYCPQFCLSPNKIRAKQGPSVYVLKYSDSGIFQLLIHFEFKVLLLTGIFIILHI